MKPPFVSSGGPSPTPASEMTKALAPGGLPGGLPKVPGMPDLPGLPDLPDLPGLPDLPDLSDLTKCLPGSCEALWGAIDKGMAPVTGVVDNAMKAAGEAKDKVVKAASDAKDKATKAVDEAKEKAAKAVEEAKEAVRKNVEMAKKYAELYQNDAKQAWAGLQSVITQQAGCALKDAAGIVDGVAPGAIDSAKGKLGQYVDEAGCFIDKGVDKAGKAVDEVGKSAADAARSAENAATGYAKDGMDALAATKKQVFESVYPVTKFYQDNGLDKLGECGSIPGRPEVPEALTDALEQIDKGTDEGIRAGSDMIAQYEQNSIIESAIYDAERYRDQGMSELAAMTDKLKSGIADAIPLSSTCGGPPLPFDGSLLDPSARERYYHKLMNEFEKMAKDAKDKMIDEIAKQAMPGGLPSGLPSGLPGGLPSGLPSGLPGGKSVGL